MATKSNFSVYMDDDLSTSLTYQSDSSGYAVISMSDGAKSISLKLSDENSKILRNAILSGDQLRRNIPQS